MSPLLSIKAIRKSYFSHGKITKEALKEVSLDVYKGEIVSLLGANGAGKTTLSSIIATLHPPTAGDLLFNGHSVFNNVAAYRQQVGFCPQSPNFYPNLTLQENLVFAGHYYGIQEDTIKNRITFLAQQLNLESYLSTQAETLSGGYKQRFLIARALLHNPQLLILDEPTVALDPHVRHQLWNIIKELKAKGMTILLTTHYLDEAEILSDRVCILDDGRIKLIDTPENLKAAFNKGRLEDVFLQLMQENQE